MAKRRALVLYGSETGNAQDGAEELAGLTVRLHFSTELLPLNHVEPRNFCDYEVVLCVLSTTGQGEVPANARTFWKKLLRKKLPADYLAACRFAMFGLGDSSYPKYNFASLRMSRRLEQLGAQEILNLGQGDEQHPEGHDSVFLPWADTLRKSLLQLFPLKAGAHPIADNVLLEPQWLLALIDDDDKHELRQSSSGCSTVDIQREKISSRPGVDDSRELEVVLQENRRVTSEGHWQDVRLLTFSSAKTSYLPGDVLVIYPRNPIEDVDRIIDLMKWDHIADRPLIFSRNVCYNLRPDSRKPSLSTSGDKNILTLRSLLLKHLDFNAIPKRSFFSLLANFTEDAVQKSRLQELTSSEYLDELYDYTTRPRRSILEVLQEFNTVKIPWQWAKAVFPEMKGRQFSIASGGELAKGPGDSTRFDLLVAIVKYRTVIRKVRRGVCTRYLESLEPGASLLVTLKKGLLGITIADVARPLILVGPGTGVAPIRSLIWQRLTWNDQLRQDTTPFDGDGSKLVLGDNLLFFGCRNKNADYFFQQEWSGLQHQLPLKVFPSFSRDQAQKFYVQDAIRANSRIVSNILYEERGLVFICGSSGKMPNAVREALIEVLEKETLMDLEASRAYLAQMEKANRYKQETW